MTTNTKKNYAWAEDILLKMEGISDADAQKVGEELEHIAKEKGKLTPEGVVAWAEINKDSELHKCFTWDVDEEASKWRLLKARKIVGRIRVYYIETPNDEPDVTHYAYQSLSVDQERQYLNIETVVNDSELTDRAVRQALIGLRQWVKRNNYLRKQLGIMDSIEVVLKKEGLL